ncbi:MAG: glycosyltransferase family 39 protein [Chitinophagales bacterium]
MKIDTEEYHRSLVISPFAFYILFFAATIVYITGLYVKVMDVDAAQYASISREMLISQHYLQVLDHGKNYLDKPPLLFWLSALSFKIFGISAFSYKLPSFLFTLLGVYSTFRLAKHLYDKTTGLLAALIIYTSQAFFLFNNDVRTDTLLTAFVIFSCWQLVLFSDLKNIWNLLAGFAGVAMAMMAKGPLGAVIPVSALLVHYVLKCQWQNFFRWQWIAGVILTLIILAPMVTGLYQQFGKEGPKFFFWTQSFGRITGENQWRNDAGYFYFTHVFLWSFLPWSILVAPAMLFSLVKIFKSRFAKDALTEYYSVGGFLLPFIALSLSKYKLPHYIFVLYPLAAIFTAAFIMHIIPVSKAATRILGIVQLIICAGMITMAIIICTQWFPGAGFVLWLPVTVGAAAGFWLWLMPKNLISRIVLPSALIAIVVNLLLNAHAYPALLKYQSGSELAAVAIKENVPEDKIFALNYSNYSFDFYFGNAPQILNSRQALTYIKLEQDFWLIVSEEILELLDQQNIQVKRIFSAEDYHITTLTLEFLNQDTRQQTTKKVYLVKI